MNLSNHLDFARSIDIPNQELESAVALYKLTVIRALQNHDHSVETIEKLDHIQEIVKQKVESLNKLTKNNERNNKI